METLDAKDTKFGSPKPWGQLPRDSRPPMDRARKSPAGGRRVERRRVDEDTVEAIQVKIIFIIIIKSLLDAT